MEWVKADELQDPRSIKKSFKQLRNSIQSYASSSLQRVAELQLTNHIPISRPLDSALKSKATPSKKKKLGMKGESSSPKHPERKNFTSPTKGLAVMTDSPGTSVEFELIETKYIQMRRSENNRILSHNTSLTDKNTQAIRDNLHSGKFGYPAKPKPSSGISSQKAVKTRMTAGKGSLRETDDLSTKMSSNKMLNQILSLYDKKPSSKPEEPFHSAKVLVPKFNLNSKEIGPEVRPESIMRKQMSSATSPFTKNYLSRVKEILSARKPSHRQSHVEQKKSPRSHKSRWTFFSSLKEGDLLKIYDMSSTENLTKHFQEKDGLMSRGSIARPDSNLPYSPHNNTNASVLERDIGSEENFLEEPPQNDGLLLRQSVISDTTTTNLGSGHYNDPRLGDAMNKLLQHMTSKDEIILKLRAENRSLKVDVTCLVQELEAVKKKLSLYTKL